MGLHDKGTIDKKQTIKFLKHKYLAYFSWPRNSQEATAAGTKQESKERMVYNKVDY